MMPKHILVIDDDADICEVAKVSLESQPEMAVTVAGSGREGLAIAALKQPDAILLDMMLPDMSGIMVFQMLRADPKTQRIPIVFLTAKVKPDDRRWFGEVGAEFIAKPFKPQQLAGQLLAALNWQNS
ncbi:response regulator [Egbenema bharatensis]|uniref:response regulator n=1 Tax=Egbenema bharatensis TaxID=3463334 RepID=UPI003A855514